MTIGVASSGLVAPLLPSFDTTDTTMASGATVRAGGLQMSLRLPRGPYFLGELLPVVVSLSNHSTRPVTYLGWPDARACVPTFFVTLSGGSPPLYALPPTFAPSCPAPMPRRLGAGSALHMALLVPLTASGRAALTAQAMLASVTRSSGGGVSISSGLGPFKAGWPSATIHVAPGVPPQRAIHLLHVGPLDLPMLHVDSQVFIIATRDAAAHLLYRDWATCASMGLGMFSWQPLRSTVIHEPACGRDERWTILVGAPGYAIASGTY